jgi:hypothetical protein
MNPKQSTNFGAQRLIRAARVAQVLLPRRLF